jgi:hypothetical protein
MPVLHRVRPMPARHRDKSLSVLIGHVSGMV